MDLNSILGTGGYANFSASGAMPGEALDALRKSLEAGYGSDSNAFTQGSALRIESLEKTMLATIQSNDHFKLVNKLAKGSATATVDEWTEQSDIGGFPGGSTNTETGQIRAATGVYKRRVEQVKFLTTRREISVVLNVSNNLVQAQALEYMNGAKQLLTDAEHLCFYGDAAVVPTEYNGIEAQVKANAPSDHIIDMAGNPLNSIHAIDDAAQLIASYGNFGRPTDLFTSTKVQSDLNTHLDPAFRVILNGSNQSVQLGSPVKALNTTWGEIATQPDVFIEDENRQQLFQLLYPQVAAANLFTPSSVALGAPGSAVDSKFAAAHAGTYYYAVAAINGDGQTAATVTAQVAIGSGQAVTLTIAPSASDLETGYVIYRSRKNGTNALTDFRKMIRIPRAPSGNTLFTDKNFDVPGSTKAFLLNMNPSDMAITWRQLLPMTKFPLYNTNTLTIPWAQALFAYLRLGKAKQHVVIKNIVPTSYQWRPFG